MQRNLLIAGAIAGVIFFAAVYGLALRLVDYSHLSQTVSEIGQLGSPVQLPYQLSMLAVDTCVIAFGIGLWFFARARTLSKLPALLVACFGLINVGVALFPSPHPLHNVFGLLLVLGYLAPLALAVSWRQFATVQPQVRASWIAAVLILISIFLNISPLFTRDLFPLEYYGVVQRSAFVIFYGWLAYLSIRTFQIAD